LVIRQNIPPPWHDEYYYFGPFREKAFTYTWNGQEFVFKQVDFAPAKYRFQAVQDGDRATLQGNYDQALEFYQQAIFSDQLEWWTPESMDYEHALAYHALYADLKLTPVPTIMPDPSEYPYLAAYARFRILLLHTARGYLPEAKIVYDTLQEKFPPDQPGHVFADIASAFWDEYQLSKRLGKACTKAIEYAANFPTEVLFYLGDNEYTTRNYGIQSPMYKIEDICPFR
jgi:tetratricopeptide (TPR) repeat protein